MPIIRPLATLCLAISILFVLPSCEQFQKIKTGELEIQFKTPAETAGRGIEFLKILPNHTGYTHNTREICAGIVRQETMSKLISTLNREGFIFRDTPNKKKYIDSEHYSLTVSEYKDGKLTRTNSVYWAKNEMPELEILQRLSEARREIRSHGNCEGNIKLGSTCMMSAQCTSNCCLPNKVTGAKTCRLPDECGRDPQFPLPSKISKIDQLRKQAEKTAK